MMIEGKAAAIMGTTMGRREMFSWLRRGAKVGVGLLVAAKLPGCAFFYTRGFNGGSISSLDGNKGFVFEVESEKDPGVMLFPGILGLEGSNISDKKVLLFDVSGWIKKEGRYARVEVQLYDEGDGIAAPSISKRIDVSLETQAVILPLEGKIQNLDKIQFILITDQGSCRVEIHNIRFE